MTLTREQIAAALSNVPLQCLDIHRGPGPFSHRDCLMHPDYDAMADAILALLADRDAGEGECPWEFDLDRACPKHGRALLECPSPPQVAYGRVAAMLAPPTPGAEDVAAAQVVEVSRFHLDHMCTGECVALREEAESARARGFAEGVEASATWHEALAAALEQQTVDVPAEVRRAFQRDARAHREQAFLIRALKPEEPRDG